MEEGTRIIRLESSPIKVTAASFEDAFGEFSEVRGRWRDRLRKRRQERQLKRISDRAQRKRARQAMRAEQQEARQSRKDTRKTRRVARREMGKEEDNTSDSPDSEQGTGGTEDTQSVGDNGGSNGVPESQPQGTEENAGQGESETTEDSDIQAGEEEASQDEYQDGFDGDGGNGINYEDLGSNDDIYALQPDNFYTYENGVSNADGKTEMVKAKIGTQVKDVARKSEWNKEMVSRIKAKIDRLQQIVDSGKLGLAQQTKYAKTIAELKSKLAMHRDRAISFDGMLNEYCNADAYSEATGRRSKKTEKKRRKAETKAAVREARKERAKVRRATKVKNKMKRKGVNPNDVTPVDQQLNPEFGDNLIVIPEKEIGAGADGSVGLIALDNQGDYDAPKENEFEFSNASGGGLKDVNWKGVLIGVAVAGLAIWGAKKAKLF